MRALSMFKPVIVIDPGHGGDEPGRSKNGTVEKNVVLAFSLMLRDKLDATGRYKVLMTRDTDVFVELNERREFAERNLAALFVAVHADYAQAKARGATIYSLREIGRQRAAALGQGRGERKRAVGQRRCRRSSSIDGDVGAVREILADLARREVDMTRDRTSVFVQAR